MSKLPFPSPFPSLSFSESPNQQMLYVGRCLLSAMRRTSGSGLVIIQGRDAFSFQRATMGFKVTPHWGDEKQISWNTFWILIPGPLVSVSIKAFHELRSYHRTALGMCPSCGGWAPEARTENVWGGSFRADTPHLGVPGPLATLLWASVQIWSKIS